MEQLPEHLLVEIMSRLNNSTDMTRCRVVSKAFDASYPQLRSINLELSLKMLTDSRPRVPHSSNSPQLVIEVFKLIFLRLVSSFSIVESVSINTEKAFQYMPIINDADQQSTDLWLTDGDFVLQWLPRVSNTLKSLSIRDYLRQSIHRPSNILQLLSVHCDKLIELKVRSAWISMNNLNPMSTLTSLTLEKTILVDEDFSMLNTSFPNLQIFSLLSGGGLEHIIIHHLHLKTFHCTILSNILFLTIITPNLTKLKVQCQRIAELNIQAPLLSNLHLSLYRTQRFSITTFENLKTLWLECLYLLSEFPVSETIKYIRVDSRQGAAGDIGDTHFTLGKLFTVFPKLTSVCIKPGAWAELQARYNPLGWGPWNEMNGFETLCAYLLLDNPSLTFTTVAIVLNHCIGLSEVSFLIHRDVRRDAFRRFKSKCSACWPGLKWRWGFWKEGLEDLWIANGMS